jgi:SDR family mycofactocin-dependent oxidoreductase
MSRFDGKVAFITGAARGQGRSHAVRLASEGADVILFDLCADPGVAYPTPTEADLEETAVLVRKEGRAAHTFVGDIRRLADLEAAVDEGISRFGRLDYVLANAGICSFGKMAEMGEEQFTNMVDINLTGQWRTVRATAPRMIEAGRGGSIVITASSSGLVAQPYIGHYAAAKAGLLGLSRALAVELGPYGIRVNTVHPVTVNTPMSTQDPTSAMLQQDESARAYYSRSPLQTWMIESEDVTAMVLWLLSDEARYVTGKPFSVDCGNTL